MENQSIAEGKDYCEHIDGLRGIAILMVIAVHTVIQCSIGDSNYYLLPYSKKLLESGSRGVQLFFILSAFTLYHSSRRRFKIDALPSTSFFIRRAFRILPFWWLAVAYYAWSASAGIERAIPSVFFYFGFIRFDSVNEVVPGGWSLFVEETFYLFLPLILNSIVGIKRSVIFLFVTCVMAAAWVFLASKVGVPTQNSFIWLSPPTNYFCFALGILVFHLYQEPACLGKWRMDSLNIKIVDCLLVVILMICVTNRYLAAFSFAALVYVSNEKKSIFGYLTRLPLLMVFGRYCFSLYLIHFALIDWMVPFKTWLFDYAGAERLPIEFRFMMLFPMVIMLALAVGFVSFNLIEKPCVDLGKKIIRRLNANFAMEHAIVQETV